MYYVYLLDGERGLYVGQTADLQHRLSEHSRGYCRSSRRIGKFECVYWWNVATRYEALKIEQYLHRIQRSRGASAVWHLSLDRARTPDLLAEAIKLSDSDYKKRTYFTEKQTVQRAPYWRDALCQQQT